MKKRNDVPALTKHKKQEIRQENEQARKKEKQLTEPDIPEGPKRRQKSSKRQEL
jgi:hypothetical protein